MFEIPFLLRDESDGGAPESLATTQEIDTEPPSEIWEVTFHDGRPLYPKGINPEDAIIFIGSDGRWYGTTDSKMLIQQGQWRGIGH